MTKRRALPVLLGLVALLLASASLPHLHAGAEAGLWNQEHDLALMATFGTQACQVDAMPVLGLVPTLPGPRAPAAPGAAPAPAATAPSTAPPSAVDLLRPRQPFALYPQRGSGQLLFDMGIAGDFVGNITSGNVERAGGGTFAGQENRFFPREVELSLFGQIDPYASAVVHIEAGEEGRGDATGVSLAEAHLTLLTLPFGTQARPVQMGNRFGYSN